MDPSGSSRVLERCVVGLGDDQAVGQDLDDGVVVVLDRVALGGEATGGRHVGLVDAAPATVAVQVIDSSTASVVFGQVDREVVAR